MGLFGRVKQRMGELKSEYKQKKYADKIIHKKARAEYLRAKEKEALKTARIKAEREAQWKRKTIGEKLGTIKKQVPLPKKKKSKKKNMIYTKPKIGSGKGIDHSIRKDVYDLGGGKVEHGLGKNKLKFGL